MCSQVCLSRWILDLTLLNLLCIGTSCMVCKRIQWIKFMSSWQKTLSNILPTDPVFLIRRKKFNLYILLKATILSSIMLVQFETPCCYNLIWLFSYKAEVPSPVEAFQLRNEYIIIVVYLISGLSIIIGGFLQNQSGFS